MNENLPIANIRIESPRSDSGVSRLSQATLLPVKRHSTIKSGLLELLNLESKVVGDATEVHSPVSQKRARLDKKVDDEFSKAIEPPKCQLVLEFTQMIEVPNFERILPMPQSFASQMATPQLMQQQQQPPAAHVDEEPKLSQLVAMLPSAQKNTALPKNESNAMHLRRLSKFDQKTSMWLDTQLIKNQEENKHCPIVKSQRRIERSLREIVLKVCMWRHVYSGGVQASDDSQDQERFSLVDAAGQITMSKKSLDDYLLILRQGQRFGYNFDENADKKVGHLRSFIKQQRKALADN